MPTREEMEFTLPRLILCEGPEDVSFFRALITERHLSNYHIKHTGKDRNDRGGRDKFASRLESLLPVRGFNKVERILFVADADEDRQRSFNSVVSQIQQAGLTPPTEVLTRSGGSPITAVMVVPQTGTGNLECLCQQAAATAYRREAALVNGFVDSVTEGRWQDAKRGKLWLRTLISSVWERDPCINLATVFTNTQPRRIIPLTDQSFDWVANFIEDFAS